MYVPMPIFNQHNIKLNTYQTLPIIYKYVHVCTSMYNTYIQHSCYWSSLDGLI